MRAAVAWGVGAALVVLAWGVAAITPDDDAAQAPFPVAATVGERAEGRNIAATVTEVSAANAVTAANGWTAEGTWVVIDLDVEAVTAEQGALLALATLTIDDRVYGASERPESLLRQQLPVGAARTGSLAFEVPEEALTGDGMLRLGLNDLDPRLDSVIELPIPLDELTVQPEVQLVETDWSGR